MGDLMILKNLARKLLVLLIFVNIKNYHQLRESGTKKSNFMRGVDYRYLAHILDVIRLTWKACMNIKYAQCVVVDLNWDYEL